MKILFLILGILVLLCAGLLVRSSWERLNPVTVFYEVSSEKLPEEFSGYRILFLTDFHSQDYKNRKENLYSMIADTKPDLILMGGDMVNAKYQRVDFSEFEKLLQNLPEGVPCYFARGNHENRLFSDSAYVSRKNEFLSLLSAHGVKLISSQGETLRIGEASLTVSSLDLPGSFYENGKKKELTREILDTRLKKTEDYHIVLVHSPLYREELAGEGADLCLSGHFHGGTIYLGEALGGLMTPQYQFFSKDCKGMKTYGDEGRAGIVSAGLGTHSINIRLNDRPEIVLVTLVKKYAD